MSPEPTEEASNEQARPRFDPSSRTSAQDQAGGKKDGRADVAGLAYPFLAGLCGSLHCLDGLGHRGPKPCSNKQYFAHPV